MEELEIKKNELIKKLEKVESNIADLKETINEAIKEEKIKILNNAQDILEGIGL